MAEIVARVGKVTGEVIVRDADGNVRRLKEGDAVRAGEVIQAASGGQVHLLLADGREVVVKSGKPPGSTPKSPAATCPTPATAPFTTARRPSPGSPGHSSLPTEPSVSMTMPAGRGHPATSPRATLSSSWRASSRASILSPSSSPPRASR
ncbi:MAG: retention module-containing protein [Dechloromonas sp.]|nr:MAG: retention module-containing protein [Dechloromonas sp.]